MNQHRQQFEAFIHATYGPDHKQPWPLCTRHLDGYLDLNVQLRWEGWKAAQASLKGKA
jgi:hypothetical protein